MRGAAQADERLAAFVAESNRIEGIHRQPTDAEIKAHRTLIARKRVKIEHVTALVAACQPNAVLGRQPTFTASASAITCATRFEALLAGIASKALTPWAAHVQYETLHPYTDGNGRSGRAVWLWQMTLKGEQSRALAIGFLHTFYYQTLAASH